MKTDKERTILVIILLILAILVLIKGLYMIRTVDQQVEQCKQIYQEYYEQHCTGKYDIAYNSMAIELNEVSINET